MDDSIGDSTGNLHAELDDNVCFPLKRQNFERICMKIGYTLKRVSSEQYIIRIIVKL